MARQMKDAGVEWIGEIPEEWSVLPLGNCFDERNEKVSDYDWEPLSVTKQGIVKQLETAAKSDAHDARKKVCEKDFVINSRSDRKQSCGISAYDGSVSLINIVLSSRFLKTEYVKYLLKNYGFAEEFYRWGTGIVADLWSTKYERMKKIMLPIPNESEQQRIADFLDEKVGEIDSVIAKTKETIEDYKKYKQAIITDAVTKGLNPDVEMKESSVDYFEMIPRSWKIIPISIAFNFVGGYAYKSEKFCGETPYQVIRLGNVKNDNFIIEEKRVFIDEEYAKESEKCKILEDDILFTMTGTKGKKDYFYTLIVKNKDLQKKELFLNQRVGCFRKAIKEVFMPYYNYLLKYENICDYIFLSETGTANQGNIGIESINTTKLLLPPIEEQKEIAEYLDGKCFEIDKLIAKKEELLADLEDYKKSLIYEYVTGKKEVE